ncbi:glutamate-rich protein 2 isoform X2 [Nelusetta ayraudi]
MSARTETNKVRGNITENPIDVSLRAEDELHWSATEHLQPRPSGLTVAGGATCASPAAEPPPTFGTNENEEQSEEEEEVDGKDIKAPLELVIEFLGAVMDRDVQLASRLCQMILLHEPDNPEARQFLPLIQEKLLEEHEMERSTEEEEDDDDSGSDEESSSSSSSSPSEEEEEG